MWLVPIYSFGKYMCESLLDLAGKNIDGFVCVCVCVWRGGGGGGAGGG